MNWPFLSVAAFCAAFWMLLFAGVLGMFGVIAGQFIASFLTSVVLAVAILAVTSDG